MQGDRFLLACRTKLKEEEEKREKAKSDFVHINWIVQYDKFMLIWLMIIVSNNKF